MIIIHQRCLWLGILLIIICLTPIDVMADVNGPNTSKNGNYFLTWTNTSNEYSGTRYKILEYKNGKYQKTYYLYSKYPKYYSFRHKPIGNYHYIVYYSMRNGSGSSYFNAGSHSVHVYDDKHHQTIFVHTDLLGSSAAETKE